MTEDETKVLFIGSACSNGRNYIHAFVLVCNKAVAHDNRF